MANLWHFEMLGGFTIRLGMGEGAVQARPATRRAAALLAYLALHPGERQPREVLADLFWPDSDPVAARGSLRQALTALRRVLEGDGLAPSGAVLLADGNTYLSLSAEAVSTDVAAFRSALARAAVRRSAGDTVGEFAALEEAVESYRGPLLPGFTEEWARQQRDTLAGDYLRALVTLPRLALERHPASGAIPAADAETALSWARRATVDVPGAEEAHAVLREVLYRLGRDAEAERHLRALEAAPPAGLNASALARLRNQEAPTPVGVAVAAAPPLPPAADVPATAAPAAPPPPLRLPLTLSRFFGREGEIAAVAGMLSAPDVRLVTLTGAGGSGKTRLAIEAARRLASGDAPIFTGGATFVPLADLREAEHLLDAVVAALGLPRSPHMSPVELAADALNTVPGRSLLILDNVEQLLPRAVAPILDLLTCAPNVTCLVTSRQTLLAEGEREVHVGPLPTPVVRTEGGEEGSGTALLSYSSVALFVNRAQVSRPDFQLTARNAADVVALVARLEGIPLAIELAAGWAQALPPAQMLRRLEERGSFDLLVARSSRKPGGSAAAARHAALRAAIEWSYDLLPEEARRLFAELSVFRGGWALEAAETVCGQAKKSNVSVVEGLAVLREHSLILTAEGGDGLRFRMLESLREYAVERRKEGDAAGVTALRARHADFYTNLVEGATARLRTVERPALLRVLDAEQENLRAALAWCATAAGGAATGLRLAGAAWRYWAVRSYHNEGRSLLATALAAPGADAPALAAERARALVGAASLAREQGDHAEAGRLAEEAVAQWHALNDPLQEGIALVVRGAAAATASDYTTAKDAYDKAEALLRAFPAGEPVRDAALAGLLSNDGAMAMEQGDFPTARTRLAEALPLARAAGDAECECRVLYNLGTTQLVSDESLEDVDVQRQEMAEAERYYQECLTRAREIEEGRMIGFALYGLGDIYMNQSLDTEAEEAYAESIALFKRGGDRRLQAAVLRAQGYMRLSRGHLKEAARPLAEAVRVLLRQGDRRQLASALSLLACVPAASGNAPDAVRLWGAAAAIRQAIGARARNVPDAPDTLAAAAARAALGNAAYEAAYASGELLSPEEAGALALTLVPG